VDNQAIDVETLVLAQLDVDSGRLFPSTGNGPKNAGKWTVAAGFVMVAENRPLVVAVG
jgi:hypothetical protein